MKSNNDNTHEQVAEKMFLDETLLEFWEMEVVLFKRERIGNILFIAILYYINDSRNALLVRSVSYR